MNDDEVNGIVQPPYDHRNAYMLFYMQDSNSLEAAVAQATAPSPEGPFTSSSSVGKKRAREDDDVEEDIGEPVRQPLLSSHGAGPSNPATGRKVGGMLPKQDRPPQLSHLAKPSLSRPPHNQLPPSEDEEGEVESPHPQKKAKPDAGDTPNREGERAEDKKKKKKKKKKRPQENIVELSSMSPSGDPPSLELSNVPSDREEEVLESSDLANKAFILSTPPLPPSTSPAAATPSLLKKRKLVDYSSGGESRSMESDDADGDRRSKKSRASSPASSVSSPLGQREREDTLWSGHMPNSMFTQSSLSPQQQQQWNPSYRPKKQKYSSQHKREQRRKSFGNPYESVGYQAGGSPSIGRKFHKRPRGI